MRRLLRVFFEGVIGAVFILVCMSLLWQWLVVKRHMMPMITGDLGRYGIIDLAGIIGPDDEVTDFTLNHVRDRVIQVPFLPKKLTFLVGDQLEATITYRRPDGVVATWSQLYLIACDERADCVPLHQLTTIIPQGQDRLGSVHDRWWAYFMRFPDSAFQPIVRRPNGKMIIPPLDSPKPSIPPSQPPRTPPGKGPNNFPDVTVARLFITGGSFYSVNW